MVAALPIYSICHVYIQYAGTVGWSKTMIEIREVPGSSPACERFFPAVLLPTVNWELVARHKGYMDAANGVVLGTYASAYETYPLTPPLRAASAARVYRVLAAVVSSLWERT